MRRRDVPPQAGRQGVQQEAADELLRVKGHQLGFAVVAIVPPSEGDLGIGHADQPGVGDCDPVCVAGEVGQNLFGAAEGWLGIDQPLDAPQLAQPACEGGRVGEVGEIAEEAEFAGLESGLQLFEEQAAEQPR